MKTKTKRKPIDRRAEYRKKYGRVAGLLILRYKGIIAARGKQIAALKEKLAALS